MIPLAERLRLVVITDPVLSPGRTLLDVVRACLRGGATCVQLREKSGDAAAMAHVARVVKDAAHSAGALFIVNDRVDVALAVGADGAHLGDDDLPIHAARKISPHGFILGASVDSVAGALDAVSQGADYLGVGPVYATFSKADAGDAIGVRPIAELGSATSLPIVGIGGITAENAAAVRRAGAAGVAVISAVMQSRDPEDATRRLLQVLA